MTSKHSPTTWSAQWLQKELLILTVEGKLAWSFPRWFCVLICSGQFSWGVFQDWFWLCVIFILQDNLEPNLFLRCSSILQLIRWSERSLAALKLSSNLTESSYRYPKDNWRAVIRAFTVHMWSGARWDPDNNGVKFFLYFEGKVVIQNGICS